jgi:ferredoxin
METNVRVELREDVCIRCASCASLVPGVFRIDATVAMLVRQPASESEFQACEAALLNCPVGAVTMDSSSQSELQ